MVEIVLIPQSLGLPKSDALGFNIICLMVNLGLDKSIFSIIYF